MGQNKEGRKKKSWKSYSLYEVCLPQIQIDWFQNSGHWAATALRTKVVCAQVAEEASYNTKAFSDG